MKLKYCHIIPPIWTIRHPDMAAGWLTEYVRQLGYKVELIDFNAELYKLEERPLVKDCWRRTFVAMTPMAFTRALFETHEPYIRKRLAAAVKGGCRVFGVLLLDAGTRFTGLMSAMIKELAPDAHVVVGGTGATSLYRLRRRYKGSPPLNHQVDLELPEDHGIDSWVLGEGEETLAELLARLSAGEPLEGIPGLALTAAGPLAPFKERPLIKDLSRLPHPTYDGFNLDLYEYDALPFQLSRGCAFARCSHCSLKGYSRGYRMRDPEHAVAELKYLVKRYGAREFHFTDLSVNGDLQGLEAFCDLLIKDGPAIKWQSFVQIRGDMTPQLLDKIVRSGCKSLNYGFESGSDAVLAMMRKPYNAKEAAKVLRMTREAGGRTVINIMTGHPGETKEAFQQTLDFLTENAAYINMVASVSFTSVLLHSPLLDECEAFDIHVDPQGRWQSHGNDINRAVRNERVHRVAEHLRLLEIPCFEAFWEPEPDEGPDHTAYQISQHGTPWARITDIHLCTKEGDIDGIIDCGDPLIVRVAYESGNYAMAVADLKITDRDGRPIFHTDTSTEWVRTIYLAEEGWLQLVLGAHHLRPGDYLISVRLRRPFSDDAFDRHVVRRVLRIWGDPGHATKVETPITWTSHTSPYPHELDQYLGLIRVTDGMGDEPLLLVVGQPLSLVADLSPGELAWPTAYYRVLDSEGELLFQSDPEALTPGETTHKSWDLTERRLNPSQYNLEVHLAGTREGDEEPEVHVATRYVEVASAMTEEHRGMGDLAMWTQWEQPGSAYPDAREGLPRIWTVQIYRHDGGTGPLSPGSRMTVDITFAGLNQAISLLKLRVWVTDEERVVSVGETETRVFSPNGMLVLHANLQLTLNHGNYHLCCSMWNEDEGRAIEPIWRFPLELR